MQTTLRILAVIAIFAVMSSAQQTPAKTPAKSSTSATKKPAATGAAESSAAKHRVALEVVHLLMPKDHTNQMIAEIDQRFAYAAAADYQRRGLTIPPDFETKMKAALAGLVSYDELTNWAADSYAQHFTTAEMQQMKTFYTGPTGRKVIDAQPEISQQTVRKLLQTVDQRLPAAMKKEGLNPPEPRAAPGQGANPNPSAPPSQQQEPPK